MARTTFSRSRAHFPRWLPALWAFRKAMPSRRFPHRRVTASRQLDDQRPGNRTQVRRAPYINPVQKIRRANGDSSAPPIVSLPPAGKPSIRCAPVRLSPCRIVTPCPRFDRRRCRRAAGAAGVSCRSAHACSQHSEGKFRPASTTTRPPEKAWLWLKINRIIPHRCHRRPFSRAVSATRLPAPSRRTTGLKVHPPARPLRRSA